MRLARWGGTKPDELRVSDLMTTALITVRTRRRARGPREPGAGVDGPRTALTKSRSAWP